MQANQQRRFLVSVLAIYFINGMAAQPLGSFIPFLRAAYGLRYDISGILLSCQSVGNFCAIILAGILPGLLGRRKSILATAAWMALAWFLVAAGFGSSAVLIAACLMNGIARGGNVSFCNTMISTLPGRESARGFNLLHAAFAMGALLAPLVLVGASTLWPVWGWRLVAAGLTVLCCVQLGIFSTMPLPAEPPKVTAHSSSFAFLRRRQFWLGAGTLFFYISAEYAIVGWLVTYFQDAGLLSAGLAQVMNSLLWLVIFAGRMLGAALAGHLPREYMLLADGVGMFGFFLLLFTARSPAVIFTGLLGTGLFMATIYPTAAAIGSDSIRGDDFAHSVMILIGASGGVIAPAAVGFVAERSGIRAGMGLVVILTALLLAMIVTCVVWLRRHKSNAS